MDVIRPCVDFMNVTMGDPSTSPSDSVVYCGVASSSGRVDSRVFHRIPLSRLIAHSSEGEFFDIPAVWNCHVM